LLDVQFSTDSSWPVCLYEHPANRLQRGRIKLLSALRLHPGDPRPPVFVQCHG
jgi:hypothetical protein